MELKDIAQPIISLRFNIIIKFYRVPQEFFFRHFFIGLHLKIEMV